MLTTLKYYILSFLLLTCLSYATEELREPSLSPRSVKLKRPSNALGLTTVHIASLVFSGESGGATEIPIHGLYRLCNTSEQELEALRDFVLTHNDRVTVKIQEKNQPDMCETTLKLSLWPPEIDETTANFMLTIRKVLQSKPTKSPKKETSKLLVK
jgi:hypothetical protein